MKKQKRKMKQNAGFSLVELIIAMTILLIVVAPILHSFITAARTNGKAKKIMQATSTAQNIMEELKAYSLAELGTVYTLTENADHTYTIEMDNVSIGKGTYNAKVQLDPTLYQKTVSESDLKYNDVARSNITYMDIYKDAFYVQDITADVDVAQEFLDLYMDAGGTQSFTYEHFLNEMSRKILLEVSVNVDPGGTSKTFVKITYTYVTSDSTISVDKRTIVKPDESKIYDNTDYTEELRGIYLFYNPLYGSTGSNIKDTIEIKNESNLDIDFYVVKQKIDGYATKEGQYFVSLNVIEKPDTNWMLDSSFIGKTAVRTNLGRNIVETDKKLTNVQSKVTYTGNGSAVDDTRSRKVLDFSSLDAPTVENKLFGTVVEIFEIKSGGGKYDAEKKLISIDGSKEE